MLRALKKQIFFSSWKNITRNSQFRHEAIASNARPALHGSTNSEMLEKPRKDVLSQKIYQLEKIVGRTGRIPENQLRFFIHPSELKVKPSSNEILSLMQCCGELAISELPSVKINNVKIIWNYMKSSGLKPDVSHYNALLRLYLNNEYEFSPMDILMEMEQQNVIPNRLTFIHLLTAYCQKGDLGGASNILEKMKKQSVPLNENIFHALIFGHCVAKDLEGAKSIINIMKEKDLLVTPLTYATFLSGLATSGDIENFDIIYKQCSEDNIKFRNDQLFNIIYHLSTNGQTSRAIEIIKSNSAVIRENLFVALNRFLEKKMYDFCFSVMEIYRNDNSDSLNDFEDKLCKLLAETEPFENIKKFALNWEEKGYSKDFMTKILYYTLKRKVFDKSLDILLELQKTGQPVKEIYFWPMVADAAKQRDVEKIFHLIRVIRNDFGIRISKTLLSKLIFDNLPVHHNADHFLINGISKIGVAHHFVTEAYVSSCISNKRANIILQLTDLGNVQNDIQSLAKCIAKDSELEDPISVANFLQNFISSAMSKKTREVMDYQSEGSNESELREGDNYTNSTGQEIVDNFMLTITTYLGPNKKNFEIQLLKELINRGLSISTEAGEKIKAKWKDPEVSALIDELTQKEFDVSLFNKNNGALRTNESEANTDLIKKLVVLCNQNMVDEAEKFVKDHPNLLPDIFTHFLMMLRRTNNEQKFTEYLKSYSSEILKNNLPLRSYVFLQTELIRKGFIKEACELMRKMKLDRIGKVVLLDLLKPVFEKGSLEEINMILSASVDQNFGVTVWDVIKFYKTKNDWNKVLNLLDGCEYDYIRTLNLGKTVISHMVDSGNIESVKRLIDILEMKVPPGVLMLDLVFAYACVGNIEKARQYLDNVQMRGISGTPRIHWLSAVDNQITIAENLVKILMGDKRFNKLHLFEDLIEVYETNYCDPSKGLELWEHIQEENIVPSQMFLVRLGRLLKRNNIEIPFDGPGEKLPDWIFDCNLPRSSKKQLLAEYIKYNLNGIENILKDLIKSGDVTISMLQNILTYSEKSEESDMWENIIKRCIELAEWKNAWDNGTLYQYAMNIGQSNNQNDLLNALPHSFLCSCLMIDTRISIPSDVAKIILWAYTRECLNDKTVSNIYQKSLENIIQNRTVLEKLLEIAPQIKAKNAVLNFLISQKVFDKHDMLGQANYVLRMASPLVSQRRFNSNRQTVRQNFGMSGFTENGGVEMKQNDEQQDVEEKLSSSEIGETEEKHEEIPRNTINV